MKLALKLLPLVVLLFACARPPAPRGALGDKTDSIAGRSFAVELLASATAVNGVPTGTAGIAINDLSTGGIAPDKVRVAVRSTAGAGTMTVTARAWLRAGGLWFVAKPLAASSAAPQTAVAIAETGTDSIAYSEDVQVVAGADRLYLEILAIAGTAAAKAELDLGPLSGTHLDTVVRAKTAGTAGNSITIAAVADGTGEGTLTLAGSAYTFHFENAVTTVTNFETLVTASALLEVKTPGTGATVLITADDFAATALAGGIDAHAVTGYAIVGR